MATSDTRFWDRAARKYAADPIKDMAGYERTIAHARRYLKATDIAYEFGCGTGMTALKLAPSVARYVATDISPEMVAIGRERAVAEACANVEFAVATADSALYADASFDAALCLNLLHLVEDRAATLRGVHRVLKPGGLFMSKTMALAEMGFLIRLLVPVMQAVGQAPHVSFFTSAELEREIVAAGFEIVERAQHSSGKKELRPFLVARKLEGAG